MCWEDSVDISKCSRFIWMTAESTLPRSVSAAITLPPPFSLMMSCLTFNNSYLPHTFDGNEGTCLRQFSHTFQCVRLVLDVNHLLVMENASSTLRPAGAWWVTGIQWVAEEKRRVQLTKSFQHFGPPNGRHIKKESSCQVADCLISVVSLLACETVWIVATCPNLILPPWNEIWCNWARRMKKVSEVLEI